MICGVPEGRHGQSGKPDNFNVTSSTQLFTATRRSYSLDTVIKSFTFVRSLKRPGSPAQVRELLLGRTSIRQNLSANLIFKVLSGLVSLTCVPIFFRVLGVSGFGLVGVWTMLETIANLLDLGLSS